MTTLVAACAVDAPPTITVDDSPAPGVDEPSGDDGADATEPTPIYWATNGVADEAGSTHLWIVDRAGDVLGLRNSVDGDHRNRSIAITENG
jgi:hypothetical protein